MVAFTFVEACCLLNLVSTILAQAPPAAKSKQTTPPKKPPSKAQPLPGGRELTEAQIAALVSRAPDEVVSQEISSRGVVGGVSKSLVERVRAKGAGKLVLETLVRLIPHASLRIVSIPGAQCLLDGQPLELIPPAGFVVRTGLDPGRHKIRIQMINRLPVEEDVDLPPFKTTSIERLLSWSVGFITVDPHLSGASVSVDGGMKRPAPVSDLAIAVGDHQITVEAPLRKTAQLQVKVEGGKSYAPAMDMPFDPEQITRQRAFVLDVVNRKLYPAAASGLRSLAEAGPLDAELLVARARTMLAIQRAEFPAAALEALAKGGKFVIHPIHRHSVGFNSRTSHEANVEVTADTFTFRPGAKCSVKETIFPLKSLELQRGNVGGTQLEPRTSVLEVIGPDPEKASKKIKLHFVAEGDSGLESALIEELVVITRGRHR